MRTTIPVSGALLATFLSSCSTRPTEPSRSAFTLPAGAKAEGEYSCQDHCGSAEPTEGACYCDALCSTFNDCCPDKVAQCDCPDVCTAVCAGEPEPPLPEGCPMPSCQCTAPCPQIAPPAPDFCLDGMIEPKKDDQGECTIGYDCLPCPMLNPPYCPDGKLVTHYDDRGVCIDSIDCVPNCPDVCAAICAGEPEPPLPEGCPTPSCQCSGDCPQIAPPAPDFCPDGMIEPKKDDQGVCTIGYDCLPCPMLNPPYCPDGTLKANYDDRGVCIVSIDCIDCPDVCGAICAGEPEPPLPEGCPTPSCQCD